MNKGMLAVLLALLLMTTAQSQDRTQVFLNHAFVVPDQATYDAIAQSQFMQKEFGAFESRTTVRQDMTYTGIYWYGTDTYFEVLMPSASEQSSSGIAFGVEARGGLQSLVNVGVPGEILPVTRQAEGKDVDWFHRLEINFSGKHDAELFIIEYEPDFLSHWYPQFPPQNPSIRRSDVLERYAAKVGKAAEREHGLLQDVSAIHLLLPPAEVEHLLGLCSKLGFTVKRGSPSVCNGPDLALVLDEAKGKPGRTGITSMEFRLTREKTGEQSLRLGTSTLEFKGRGAKWVF